MPLRGLVRTATFAALLLAAPAALADKVVVLPFSPSAQSLKKPELEEARGWAKEAVRLRGHSLPSEAEVVSAERAVTDGVADTSQEYRAAGRAAGAAWSITGHVDRVDVPAKAAPDGTSEDGYTVFRVELEVCQVESGRVETLLREVDGDEAPAQIAEMLALLVRPEGIANAELPWERRPRKKPKPKPAPPPAPEAPRQVTPPTALPLPEVPGYGSGHPLAIGVSVGVTNALVRPDQARGPSWAMPIGGVVGYALEDVRGLELRAAFSSQVLGPEAIEIAGGARYAFMVLPMQRPRLGPGGTCCRLFVGPELLAGAFVALGADKTARFVAHGAAFAALALGEQVQVEIAGDLAAALGGSGTLVLGGGTARALYRF